MAVLLLESEIKCLLATKFLQMSFTVSNRETIGFTVKGVRFGVCANTLIMSSLHGSIPFTQKICTECTLNLTDIFLYVMV